MGAVKIAHELGMRKRGGTRPFCGRLAGILRMLPHPCRRGGVLPGSVVALPSRRVRGPRSPPSHPIYRFRILFFPHRRRGCSMGGAKGGSGDGKEERAGLCGIVVANKICEVVGIVCGAVEEIVWKTVLGSFCLLLLLRLSPASLRFPWVPRKERRWMRLRDDKKKGEGSRKKRTFVVVVAVVLRWMGAVWREEKPCWSPLPGNCISR